MKQKKEKPFLLSQQLRPTSSSKGGVFFSPKWVGYCIIGVIILALLTECGRIFSNIMH